MSPIARGATAAGFDPVKHDATLGPFTRAISDVKAQTYDPIAATSTTILADAVLYLAMMWLPAAETITGLCFNLTTIGDYTADQNNKVGLWSISGTTGTLVASSANDGALFKPATSRIVSKDFSAPYAASRGLYVAGFLYNNSAVVTNPAVGRVSFPSNANFVRLSNGRWHHATTGGKTDLPASLDLVALAATGGTPYMGVY